MNFFLTKVFFCVGISWATTVIRREVGKSNEAPSSLDVEVDKNTVHLGAGGQMVHLKADSATSDFYLQEGSDVKKKNAESDFDESYEDRDIDMCDDDYPLGNPNSTDCAIPALHHLIHQQNMCREAAAEANATIDEPSFLVPTGYQKYRPLGCFSMACEHDPNGNCYYFNRYDQIPENILGTPVCVRYKFRNGTLDANATDGVSCPVGYQHITNENNCSLAATCLGADKGSPFGIVKEERDKYTAGCFMHKDIGAFYFNPVIDENGTKWAAPTNPTGTPLCNVSHITHWPPVQA